MRGAVPVTVLRWIVVPFKANAERRHYTPKRRRRATNSATYDATLRQPGRVVY